MRSLCEMRDPEKCRIPTSPAVETVRRRIISNDALTFPNMKPAYNHVMRKMLPLSGFATIATLAFALPANAQVATTADQLADYCRHKWPDYQYFYCAGYLQGVVDTLQVGAALAHDTTGRTTLKETASGAGALCIASSIVPDELAKAFVAYVERHPERKEALPRVVAGEALIALDEAPPVENVYPLRWEICGRKPPAR